MSTEMSCHFIHLLQVQKMSSKSDFIQFFHDVIHVYSPGAEADSPRGQNFDVNRKVLSLYRFIASFKEMSLKSDFIQFLYVYSPGAEGIQGNKNVDVNRNFLSLRSSVASFKSQTTIVSEKSIVLPFFHTKA